MDALVGRDEELDALERSLGEACAGSARFVVVTGEPGIGKTSLLAALLRRAEERGCLVLEGSAAEFERELPFGVVVDAFDEYVESLDPRALSGLAAEDLGELAGVFPALRLLDRGSDQPSTPAERFRAHRAVCRLIERLAASQPLILLLDDLHWADGASLELASHLLRRPPRAGALVAVAFRVGQADRALEATIGAAMRKSGAVQRIELGPLRSADARALVDVGSAAEHERLYRASGGNPFYMLQLAHSSGGDDHGQESAGEAAGVPAAIVAAIVGELDGLSAPARRLCEAAAVAGDPFELDLAVATAAMVEPEALVALDELVESDLVQAGPVPRRFRFRHPLVRRAVYEACSPGTRLTAHRRSALALATSGAPATTRAHHVEHSARQGDRDAVAVLREAAEATVQRAPESAARWFEGALRLLPQSETSSQRVELLTARARALSATGRFEDSRAALLASVDLTPETDTVSRVRLIGACAAVEQLLGHHDEAHARLTAALHHLPNSSAPEGVELLIQLASGDFYRMDYEGMRGWGERAGAAAQQLGEPLLTATGRAVLAVAEAFRGDAAAAEAHCSGAAGIVDHLPDEELARRLDALANLCAAELYLHHYDVAAAHAKRGLAIAHATGQAELSPVLVPVLSAALHLSGRVRESAELLDEAVEAARLAGNVEALGWNLLSRAFTAVAAGDLELALGVAQESVDVTRDLDDRLVSTNAGLALAHALFETGAAERAIDVLLRTAGGEELPLIPGGWRANYFELLTRCWLALGGLTEAEQAAAHAAATADRVGLELAAAMAHRAAGAVALESGNPGAAAHAALTAATGAEETGARVDAALARILAGRALARAGKHERAVAELERAASQLHGFGAVRYRNQAERELRKLGHHVHRRTAPGKLDGAGVDTLTQREAEIAHLVVRRHTNPEIAAELFLSVKTIESHMRNIFRKLDVGSRVEVARLLERGP